jgi:2,3-bisphosphoglycerate-dependent phosphoglycerate mutase
MELWLVRHGETEYNLQRRHQGQLDVPLSNVGLEQAHKLAVRLSKTEFAAVYASDLSRALHTAEIAFAGQVQTDVRWREFYGGWLEGMLYSEAASATPRPPEGESRAAITARVMAAIGELYSQHAGTRVIVFSHGGTIRAALHAVLDDVERQIDFAERGNTSISKLEVKANLRGRLLVYNDTAHLEDWVKLK